MGAKIEEYDKVCMCVFVMTKTLCNGKSPDLEVREIWDVIQMPSHIALCLPASYRTSLHIYFEKHLFLPNIEVIR